MTMRLPAVLFAAALSTVALPAQAAPPSVGVHFTRPDAAGGPDCSWSHPTGCTYVQAQVNLIDAVPAWKGKGHPRPVVYLTLYSSNQPRLTDAAARASKRGAAVHLVTWKLKRKDPDADPDGDAPTGERARIVSLLKQYPQNTVTVCQGSCMAGGKAGRMHAKLTATYDGGSRYRVISGSGNSVLWTDETAWNDFVVMESKSQFREVTAYLDAARKDKHQKSPKPVTDHGVTLYLFPQLGDPLLAKLKAVKPKAGCTVRVDQWQASNSKRTQGYVKQLVRIDKGGAYVRAIGDSSKDDGGTPNWSAKITKRFKDGGVTLLDGRGKHDDWLNHEKSVSIYGCGKADGDWRGSVNFKMGSTNMENQVWRAGTAAAKQGVDRDNQIAGYSKPW